MSIVMDTGSEWVKRELVKGYFDFRGIDVNRTQRCPTLFA